MKKLFVSACMLLLFHLSVAQQSHCEDRPYVPNNGWCLPAPNGGQYCGSAACNCTCDATYWDWIP